MSYAGARKNSKKKCGSFRKSCETSSRSTTLPAVGCESCQRVRSASAFPVECALTRSAAPHTKLENADRLAPEGSSLFGLESAAHPKCKMPVERRMLV